MDSVDSSRSHWGKSICMPRGKLLVSLDATPTFVLVLFERMSYVRSDRSYEASCDSVRVVAGLTIKLRWTAH